MHTALPRASLLWCLLSPSVSTISIPTTPNKALEAVELQNAPGSMELQHRCHQHQMLLPAAPKDILWCPNQRGRSLAFMHTVPQGLHKGLLQTPFFSMPLV